MSAELETNIIKGGYLRHMTNRAKGKWKERYFVLTDGALTYFQDHSNMTAGAKGDLLLVPDSKVLEFSATDQSFCLIIMSAFDSLVVSASSVEDRDAWIKAIEYAIMKAHKCIRAYITKKGDRVEIRRSRKFFVLKATVITWHQDHEHTSVAQGSMKLCSDILMTAHDDSNQIFLSNRRTHDV